MDSNVHDKKMAVILEQAKGGAIRKWECKQCHQLVVESEIIAYHLIDGILYGWCETCFRERGKVVVELAA